MADTKISALTALTGAGTASDDALAIVDTSATASKKITIAEFIIAIKALSLTATYQPLDADLTAIAGLTSAADALPYFTGSGTAGVTTLTSYIRGLLDDVDAATARGTLGLGTGATATIANYLPLLAGGAAVENAGSIESNVNTVATTGSTETLDLAVYGWHDCTMDQNCTFTFSNPAPSGKNTTFALVLRGAFTPTLPASVKWSSATPPTYTTPALYIFATVDGGTNYLGQQVGKAFA